MSIIYKNENEESSGGRANLVGIILCVERVSRCLEGEHIRRSGRRIIRI